MKALKIGSSLTFAASGTLLVVFATFVTALISNTSKRIPGVVDISVIADGAEAGVGITWGIGLLVVFVAFVVMSIGAANLAGRTDS